MAKSQREMKIVFKTLFDDFRSTNLSASVLWEMMPPLYGRWRCYRVRGCESFVRHFGNLSTANATSRTCKEVHSANRKVFRKLPMPPTATTTSSQASHPSQEDLEQFIGRVIFGPTDQQPHFPASSYRFSTRHIGYTSNVNRMKNRFLFIYDIQCSCLRISFLWQKKTRKCNGMDSRNIFTTNCPFLYFVFVHWCKYREAICLSNAQ